LQSLSTEANRSTPTLGILSKWVNGLIDNFSLFYGGSGREKGEQKGEGGELGLPSYYFWLKSFSAQYRLLFKTVVVAVVYVN